jgi:hypothetical protein
MSSAPLDFEALLRDAIKQAKERAPRAVDDLLRLSSMAARAVAGVTAGAASLELAPINQAEGARPAYQLVLRKIGSEAPPSELGVYAVTAAGYPVLRWFSRGSWELGPDEPAHTFTSTGELEGHFKWLISSPESRLVMLVTFFQEQAGSSARAS